LGTAIAAKAAATIIAISHLTDIKALFIEVKIE